MFGELVGACLADCWSRAGRPAGVCYVELGPGRGSLSSDALRALRSAGLDPPVHFVETSPVLREAQSRAVPAANWHDDLSTVPERPLLIVANEFFDALPIRQFVGGIERQVVLAGGELAFDRDGDIAEDSPARQAAVHAIAQRLGSHGGAALIIDYGEKSASGDTLQAVHRHRFAPVLDAPGEQDLTAHVDFKALARAASIGRATITKLIDQGDWLERLGIASRAQALAKSHPERADEIEAARKRLCDPAGMGRLFKVMAIHAHEWPVPAGFE